MSNQTKEKLLGGTQGRRLQRKKPSLDWQSALQLDHQQQVLVYQRLSTTEQIKNSPYSLAISDSYEWILNPDERQLICQSGNYSGWYQNGQIIVEQRDLGLSGTLGQADRAGLEHLINLIEANRIETVYVLHISRLFRDQTLIDAFAFAELCKKHDVKIITPAMRLNLRISMHMDYYQREADWAAKELEVRHGRLYGAKKRKAHQGCWAGGYLPVGYVLDERETIEGHSNPDWHKFIPYEPHARVVR